MIAPYQRPFAMANLPTVTRTKEKLDEKFIFMETGTTAKMIDAEASTNQETRSDVIRRALDLYFNPRPNEVKDEAFNSFRAPYLSAVPCGPWQEAIDRGEAFTVSTEVADELEARDGDVWVRADGQSMEGAGIMDGFLILVRPMDGRPPRRGDIMLVQAMDDNGSYFGTVKRFNGVETDGRTPRLLNGSDEEFPLPSALQRVDYIGRAIGVLGRL